MVFILRRGPGYHKPIIIMYIAVHKLDNSRLIWRKQQSVFVNKYAIHMMPEDGPRFNIKMLSCRYRKYPCGDKTVVRSPYLRNGISYTGKMTSGSHLSTKTVIPDIGIPIIKMSLTMGTSILVRRHLYIETAPKTHQGWGLLSQFPPVPLFPQICSPVKTNVNYKISRSYLTGVTAAELRRHQPNMNVI